MTKKVNVSLFGYLGFGNIGDELMLIEILKSLLKLENIGSVYVLTFDYFYFEELMEISKNNERVKIIYYERNIFRRAIQLGKVFKCVDLSIWTGGTPYNKKDGFTPLKYAILQRIFINKYVQLGIGVGELDFLYKLSTKASFMLSDKLVFRDNKSYNEAVTTLGLRKSKCELAEDIVWSHNISSTRKENGVLCVSLHFLSQYYDMDLIDNRRNVLLRNIIELYSAGSITKVKVVSVHPMDDEENLFFHNLLSEKEIPSTYRAMESVNGAISEINDSELFLGERLHSIIIAIKCGCKVFPVAYSRKVEILFNSFEMEPIPTRSFHEINISNNDFHCVSASFIEQKIDMSLRNFSHFENFLCDNFSEL